MGHTALQMIDKTNNPDKIPENYISADNYLYIYTFETTKSQTSIF